VLTQDRAGPTDLTVALALALTELGATVRLFGPAPVSSAGDARDLLTPVSVSRKRDISAARRLREAISAFGPDIVHAQDRRAALTVCALAPLKSTPIVSTYHGLPDQATHFYTGQGGSMGLRIPPKATAVMTADAVVARRCEMTVTPAAAMARFLHRYLRVPANRVRVIHNGVPIYPARPLPERPRVLMTAGSFSRRKAAWVLVEAFIRLAADQDVSLLLVGGSAGDEREALRERLRKAGLEHRVEFTGYRTDVQSFLARSEIFVLPSLAETLPLALLEAMGAGLACVASDAGSVSEALPPGTGLLTRPGDVEGLESALRRLLEVPGLASALGAGAAAHARRHFAIETCAQNHLDLYADVLGRPGGAT
jgi:glycosyltransferase involved in cell wall biosynthesis